MSHHIGAVMNPEGKKLSAQESPPAGASGDDDHGIAQLACLGAMFAPDPFTAFSQVKLSETRPSKMRAKDRRPPSAFDAFMVERYHDE